MEAAQWLDMSNSESPEFIGRAVAALAADPGRAPPHRHRCWWPPPGAEYGFTDIDGKAPRPLTLGDV